MMQARIAFSREIKGLAERSGSGAGQKTRIGWQGLPGGADFRRVGQEIRGCR
jgi:hypothetical protein